MDNLGEQVNQCKGNSEKISELIERYSPFIYNTVFEKLGTNDDDMLQVARIAFTEAVENYSQVKGNFISFAEIIMNNRMNDELRKRYRRQGEVGIDDTDGEDSLHKEAVRDYNELLMVQQRKSEIGEYLMELLKWGFYIEKLEEYCPKHKDTREMCKFAAHALKQNIELKEQMLKNKHLPVKKLAKATMLKERFLEKHCKYITMIFIALNGTYYVIQDYIGGDLYGRK